MSLACSGSAVTGPGRHRPALLCRSTEGPVPAASLSGPAVRMGASKHDNATARPQRDLTWQPSALRSFGMPHHGGTHYWTRHGRVRHLRFAVNREPWWRLRVPTHEASSHSRGLPPWAAGQCRGPGGSPCSRTRSRVLTLFRLLHAPEAEGGGLEVPPSLKSKLITTKDRERPEEAQLSKDSNPTAR